MRISGPLRLCYSSSALPKRVLSEETSKCGREGEQGLSIIRWELGRSRLSTAAATSSVPSESEAPKPKVKVTGKRLSLKERRAMVEPFVNKYRATNSGKFPTASMTMKEVGGSFYSVKKILQELEYESKISSIDTAKEILLANRSQKQNELGITLNEASDSHMSLRVEGRGDSQLKHKGLLGKESSMNNSPLAGRDEMKVGPGIQAALQATNESSLNEEVIKEVRSSAQVEVVLSMQTDVPREFHKDADALDIMNTDIDASFSQSEPKESMKYAISVGKTDLNKSAITSAMGDNSESLPRQSQPEESRQQDLHSHSEKPETHLKEETSSENMSKSDVLKPRSEQRVLPESENIVRDPMKEKTNDEEYQVQSSIWKGLKSFAEGIMSLWKKP